MNGSGVSRPGGVDSAEALWCLLKTFRDAPEPWSAGFASFSAFSSLATLESLSPMMGRNVDLSGSSGVTGLSLLRSCLRRRCDGVGTSVAGEEETAAVDVEAAVEPGWASSKFADSGLLSSALDDLIAGAACISEVGRSFSARRVPA